MIKVYWSGALHAHIERPEYLSEMADNDGIVLNELTLDADDLAAYQAQQRIAEIRKNIDVNVGDTPSIQGTIADNVALLMEGLGRFMQAASNSTDPIIADASVQLRDDLKPFIDAIDAGTCVPTHHVKTPLVSVSDACERTHGVSMALIAAANEQE